MNRRKPFSKPPALYEPQQGTKYCLTTNEYDKNTYAQCSFVGNRTLIRCRQIRSKDDLNKNNGICDEHEELSRFIKNNYSRELLRMHAECDQGSYAKKKKYSNVIVADGNISDEDEWLQPLSSVAGEIPEQINEEAYEDEILSNAGVFTEKDLIRMRIGMIDKDVEDLRFFRNLLEARASRRYDFYSSEDSKAVQLDPILTKVHKAKLAYATSDYLSYYQRQGKVLRNICQYGHIDDGDEGVIEHLMESIKCALSGAPQPHACLAQSLPGSRLCINHIITDPKQKLFSACRICGQVSAMSEHRLCDRHTKNTVLGRRQRLLAERDKLLREEGVQRKQIVCKKALIESDDEEEKPASHQLLHQRRTATSSTSQLLQRHDKVSNLIKHAEMPSPMPPLPSPSNMINIPLRPASPLHHFRQQRLKPSMFNPEVSVGEALVEMAKMNKNAKPGEVPMMEEGFGCARERVFVGNEKKKNVSAARNRKTPKLLSQTYARTGRLPQMGKPDGGQLGSSSLLTSNVLSNMSEEARMKKLVAFKPLGPGRGRVVKLDSNHMKRVLSGIEEANEAKRFKAEQGTSKQGQQPPGVRQQKSIPMIPLERVETAAPQPPSVPLPAPSPKLPLPPHRMMHLHKAKITITPSTTAEEIVASVTSSASSASASAASSVPPEVKPIVPEPAEVKTPAVAEPEPTAPKAKELEQKTVELKEEKIEAKTDPPKEEKDKKEEPAAEAKTEKTVKSPAKKSPKSSETPESVKLTSSKKGRRSSRKSPEEAKKPATPSSRTPRAAAIAANSAITKKSLSEVKEEKMVEEQTADMDPLSMLAAVSEFASKKEERRKSEEAEAATTSRRNSLRSNQKERPEEDENDDEVEL